MPGGSATARHAHTCSGRSVVTHVPATRACLVWVVACGSIKNQYNTAQTQSTKHITIQQFITIYYNTTHHNTPQENKIHHNTTPPHTTHHITSQHTTKPHNTMQQHIPPPRRAAAPTGRGRRLGSPEARQGEGSLEGRQGEGRAHMKAHQGEGRGLGGTPGLRGSPEDTPGQGPVGGARLRPELG